jgi:non-homologous end joining protein Ku
MINRSGIEVPMDADLPLLNARKSASTTTQQKNGQPYPLSKSGCGNRYEFGKGRYVEVEPDELEAIALESKRMIEIDEFLSR